MGTIRPISVINNALRGISDTAQIRTFIINGLGVSKESLVAHMESVAFLQTVSPDFSVVVVTHLPIFAEARYYGWPVEHIMPLEYSLNYFSRSSINEYYDMRISLIQRRYSRPTIVQPASSQYLGVNIANSLGMDGLGDMVRERFGVPASSIASSNVREIVGNLRSHSSAIYESIGGRAHISLTKGTRDRVFIIASLRQGFEARSHVERSESDFDCIEIGFDASVSLQFEAHLYKLLSDEFGSRSSVVNPYREEAVFFPQLLASIDLAVRPDDHSGFQVLESYSSNYERLNGSRSIDWNNVILYSSIRKFSRFLASR